MAVERIIGVDFGTSTSVIRVKRYENGNPIGEKLETKEVVFGGSGAMVPTLIMKKDDDTSVCYFGYEAQQKKKKFTNFHSFKMDLESSDPAKRAQARLLTEEFYAYLAKQYKSQSEGGHLGNPDDKERTIISYPVKWSEVTKRFMLETAKKAGFPNVTGMDEAQAAIQAVIVMSTDHLQKHGLLKNGEAANILLIDMGAGTTDLVLTRYVPGDETKAEVLNTWPRSGDIQFGGREIDDLLQNFFRDLLDEDDAEMVFRRIGSDKFKSWKEETVSPALHKHDSVSDFEVLDSCVDMMGIDLEDYCLDRAALEKCLRDYLKQFPELINGCLQNAGMSGADVDLVIVTGGHSQWYFVNDMLCGKMPQFGALDLPKIRENPARIIPISRPQETVALGLAYSQLHFETTTVPEPPKNQLLAEVIGIAEFAMEIQQVFQEPGGTCVRGTVAKGAIHNGDAVCIYKGKDKPEIYTKVNRIPNTWVPADKGVGAVMDALSAEEGEDAVILLDGVKEEDVSAGLVLYRIWMCTYPKKASHTLEELVLRFFENDKGKLGRDLPENAIPKLRVNLNVPNGEEVLAAWDSTMFGSCKNGTVMTPRGIYCRALLMDPEFHTWSEFAEGTLFLDDNTGNIYVKGTANGKDLRVGFFLASKMKEAFEFYKELQAYLRREETGDAHGGGKQDVPPDDGSYNFGNPNDSGSKLPDDGSNRQTEQQDIEQKRKQAIEEARRRAAAMQIDPKDIPYTPDSEFEIGSVGGKDCSIKKYLGNSSVVKIPSTIQGRKVVSIEATAFGCVALFQANRTIEMVIIPETVRKIEFSAFNECRNLKAVIAHKNIESIGANAFYGCNSLHKMDFGMGDCADGHVIFPPSLKSIGAQAFLKRDLFSTCIFKEILMSKRTKVKDIPGVKNFNPKYCAVFYYD